MSIALPKHVQERIAAARDAEMSAKAIFANLSDADLAVSARFWMQHCDAPKRIEPGLPVYDSTFWHAIAPEMIRRLAESDSSFRKRTREPQEIPLVKE